MSYITENASDRDSRLRTGRIVALACVAWWIASIGGIIFVLNTSS